MPRKYFSRHLVHIVIFSQLFVTSYAQVLKRPPRFPSLPVQLSAAEARPGTALDSLIRANQDFGVLRIDEANELRGLPPWLRVFWRKAHPEGKYAAEDPSGGYPLVLKEVLEWMSTHQDLKPGMGIEPDEYIAEKNIPLDLRLIQMLRCYLQNNGFLACKQRRVVKPISVSITSTPKKLYQHQIIL
ncbi:MAG: hypothetical protein ABIX01_15435 [Chitinophagaceae bacterium]